MSSGLDRVPVLIRTQEILVPSHGRLIAARPYLDVLFGPRGADCYLDTGAPLSVVTHDLARGVPWTPWPGPYHNPAGGAVSIAWDGLPCVLGEAPIALLDPGRPGAYRVCRLVGKFVQQPHPRLSNLVLLGLNFLTDNAATLEVTGSPILAGELRFP